jgi:hypothetical protein
VGIRISLCSDLAMISQPPMLRIECGTHALER